MMKRLEFGLALALLACGSLTDPSKGGGETVATVSGALTATNVPDGARVALVWKNGKNGKWAVGSDVPLVDGRFSIALSAPPDEYLYSADEEKSYDEFSSSAEAPASGSSGTGSNTGSIGTRDVASGGIAQPLNVAVAGFVVYVDNNGNGKLDLKGSYADTDDEIIGGNKELYLAYLSGGGGLAYEKLRDGSGRLPVEGYNLSWTEKSRWIPLNLVELELRSSMKLPYPVCDGSSGPSPSSQDAPMVVTVKDGGSSGVANPTAYPLPTDPDLRCYDNGRTFVIEGHCSTSVQPTGLCAGWSPTASFCSGGWGDSLGPTGSVPEGWPCVVVGNEAQDAGTP